NEAAGQDSPAAQAADAGDGRSELQLASTPPPHGLDLLPRRGLLARLLGRRRRAATQALGGGDSFELRAVRSPGLRPWPTASAEWVHQFPRREPDSEIAPARAEPEPSVEDMLGEHDAPAEAAPATADDPVLRGEEPPIGAHAKGRPGDGTDHVVEPQARGQGEHHSGPGEQSAGGAGHEAGSAEQDAGSSEQDAAVLSAVLDRLGAAHHRPFSRA
ncbi:MAG: hypothetical protein ACJ8H8_28135, partial [Geminicoccaceae bacterium]